MEVESWFPKFTARYTTKINFFILYKKSQPKQELIFRII